MSQTKNLCLLTFRNGWKVAHLQSQLMIGWASIWFIGEHGLLLCLILEFRGSLLLQPQLRLLLLQYLVLLRVHFHLLCIVLRQHLSLQLLLIHLIHLCHLHVLHVFMFQVLNLHHESIVLLGNRLTFHAFLDLIWRWRFYLHDSLL